MTTNPLPDRILFLPIPQVIDMAAIQTYSSGVFQGYNPMRRSSKTVSCAPLMIDNATYKICQMDMALRIQQHIVRLHIPMYNPLLVNIPQRASQLCDPELDCIFRKRLARNVKSQITSAH